MSGRSIFLAAFALVAFAGNSLLCRAALKLAGVDAASFTAIRLVSGAVTLWLILRIRRGFNGDTGNWISAFALFLYAALFSFAYARLTTATGALLLFGAVQITMISYGLYQGERLLKPQFIGFIFAFAGLIGLLLPGLAAPPLYGSVLMLGAGVAWGVYSLRGKIARNPLQVTAGNFLRAAFIAIIAEVFFIKNISLDATGIALAVASGALTSGIGYAVWYAVLPELKATNAAIIQLAVPVIATLGGIAFLSESVTLRLVLASAAILGGIALAITQAKPRR